LLDVLASSSPLVTVSGTVTGSRQHGQSLSFHDFRSPHCACPLQVVLSPQHFAGGREACDTLAPLLRFFSAAYTGRPERAAGGGGAGSGTPSLHVHALALQRLTAAPAEGGVQAIERVLRACRLGVLAAGEACQALGCSADALAGLLALQLEDAPAARFALKQALLALSRAAAGLPPGRPPGRQRPPTHSHAELATLEAAEGALPPHAPALISLPAAGAVRGTSGGGGGGGSDGGGEGTEVEEAGGGGGRGGKGEGAPGVAAVVAAAGVVDWDALHPVQNIPLGDQHREIVPPNHGERRKGVQPAAAAAEGDEEGKAPPTPLLPPRSQRTREQYAHFKKAPQVVWFLGALGHLIAQVQVQQQQQQGQQGQGVGPKMGAHPLPVLSLVDVGGGRGDLALAVAATFPHAVRVTVIDLNAASLSAGEARAKELGIANMGFVAADVFNALDGPALAGVDLFFGLHTCGGLTDAVISLALRKQCAFLLVPCCYTKNASLVLRCARMGLVVDAAAAAAAAAGDGAAAAVDSAEGVGEPQQQQQQCARAHAVLCRLAESPDASISLRSACVLNARRLVAAREAREQASAGRLAVFELFEAFSKAASKKNLALCASPRGIATML
jgi:hypothetical protein